MKEVKLTDLNPNWVGAGGSGITRNGEPVEERHGIAIMFDCPCDGECKPKDTDLDYKRRVCLHLENPLDGKPYDSGNAPQWKRTGEDFETLTLRPSILRMDGCKWHGFLTDGILKQC